MTCSDAFRDGGRIAALYRLYTRTVGATQVLYALFFGWIAFITLSLVVQT